MLKNRDANWCKVHRESIIASEDKLRKPGINLGERIAAVTLQPGQLDCESENEKFERFRGRSKSRRREVGTNSRSSKSVLLEEVKERAISKRDTRP
jgi:hypothetical protein